MSESIKIDIWSDIACPWCYIGKRKFETGAAAFAEQSGDGAPDVIVEYHSYELSPDTPVDFDGDEIDFLATHKGMPAEQVRGMLEHVTGVAKAAGLDYNFDILKHTNTVKAHQLLHYAKARGKQIEATERLLAAYFTEGRHVGRVEDLADLAAEVGLDRADVLRSLQSDEFLSDVRADQALAQEYGVQGVPFFVIDGKYGVSGAQEAATFAQVLEQVWAERTEAATV
ncbi:putative DsbA family dithiol-disulfide isomerase [Okibacterium sp. HSC-33S16]|uniref:DsbA family oxidoreductase n=1 Tax=Okibacterium sp. HSC-33S16 TaxID=2910965 RepID=UPI0020A0F850|nr:DsbA family oxidoreductase [Okibacterium sp. HSC-33S16]MCP2030717.1 putative DsbA family dithiol-disulfide isomerase [Okibacterium sp. HSC-33S16]